MSGDKDGFDLSHLLDPPRFGTGMAVPGLRRRYIGLGGQRYSHLYFIEGQGEHVPL